MTVYLDNSATTRPMEEVVDAMQAALRSDYYNPSALYVQAVGVEKQMEACRQWIKKRLPTSKGRIVFTSGGTEANNLAILGNSGLRRRKGTVLYSMGEHAAVAESCKALATEGWDVQGIPLTKAGQVDIEALEQLLNTDVAVLCVMQVNNETGAIQPLREVASLRNRLCPDAFLHVDGVQGFLRETCDVDSLGIDSYALSGHKIHGPKGIGALWMADRMRIKPLLYGGGQEQGLRSGTENTPGIAGLLAAVELYPAQHHMRQRKLRLWHALRSHVPEVQCNGPDPQSDASSDHILNVSFPPVASETMLHVLEAQGVLVGNGAACSAKKRQGSPVLRAMGIEPAVAACAIRFSLNPYISDTDIDYAVQACASGYEALRGYRRR